MSDLMYLYFSKLESIHSLTECYVGQIWGLTTQLC